MLQQLPLLLPLLLLLLPMVQVLLLLLLLPWWLVAVLATVIGVAHLHALWDEVQVRE